MKSQLNTISSIALTLLASLASQNIHAEESAPCYANVNGQLMHVVTVGLESCARTIQAAGPRNGQMAVGRWGNYEVVVDQNSSVYLNGQPVGRAKNLSGTYGNLSDRCKSGDTAACDQFYRQTERAIQQYDRMYPPGWNR